MSASGRRGERGQSCEPASRSSLAHPCRKRNARASGRVAGLVLLLAATPLAAQTVAITNARIYPVAGPVIERGTVVIRDGKIPAVGASVAAPGGARVIDATGKIVTPGLLDSSTGLGTVEIGLSAEGTDDLST